MTYYDFVFYVRQRRSLAQLPDIRAQHKKILLMTLLNITGVIHKKLLDLTKRFRGRHAEQLDWLEVYETNVEVTMSQNTCNSCFSSCTIVLLRFVTSECRKLYLTIDKEKINSDWIIQRPYNITATTMPQVLKKNYTFCPTPPLCNVDKTHERVLPFSTDWNGEWSADTYFSYYDQNFMRLCVFQHNMSMNVASESSNHRQRS